MRDVMIHITDDEWEILKIYEALSGDSKKMVDIVFKIADSHLLNEEEFCLLIQNLMHKNAES